MINLIEIENVGLGDVDKPVTMAFNIDFIADVQESTLFPQCTYITMVGGDVHKIKLPYEKITGALPSGKFISSVMDGDYGSSIRISLNMDHIAQIEQDRHDDNVVTVTMSNKMFHKLNTHYDDFMTTLVKCDIIGKTVLRIKK